MTTKQETIEYFRKNIIKKYVDEVKKELKEKENVKKDD